MSILILVINVKIAIVATKIGLQKHELLIELTNTFFLLFKKTFSLHTSIILEQ